MIIFPSVNSTVIVALSTQNSAFVLMYSDIDKVQYMDGSFGGMIKVKDGDDPTVGLLKKINNLENLVNSILNALKTTTIPLAPSGTYPFAPLYAAINEITPITSESDLVNDLVVHGKNP